MHKIRGLRLSRRVVMFLVGVVSVLFTFGWVISPAAPVPGSPQGAGAQHLDAAVFKAPPAEFRGMAKWGYMISSVTDAQIRTAIREMAQRQLFGGFFLANGGASAKNLPKPLGDKLKRSVAMVDDGVEYLSEEYFRLYRVALEEAAANGVSLVLYDENWHPTGIAAGQIAAKFPQYVGKSLEKIEKRVSGPATVELAIPPGTYLGAVLMNRDTFETTDVSDRKTPDNRIACRVGKGEWTITAFYLDHEAALNIAKPGIVDYLDANAMNAFLGLTYENYYAHFKEYFGTTIKVAFWDEPAMHQIAGRMWTPDFNKEFKDKYGYSPIKFYPALFGDIGPQTAAARNALFGFRAELFATNFVGKIRDWCHAHGIQSTGHLDQEEIINPVPVNGDLLKVFEHQDIPGIDDIWVYGRSNPSYKVVTSAAYNYDKPLVAAETYEGYREIDDAMLFQVAMDQYAMGVNFQVPAATLMQRKLTKLSELNRYVGRLSYVLQNGRHVADIAVLYPIASLQAAYRFLGGAAYASQGGVVPPEIDYMDIGEALFRGLRVDYTYLHPEVLAGRCVVEDRKLILNNPVNREEYSVLVVPGGDTLSVATARKIQEFYSKGGTVIATSKLATRSAEFGQDAAIRQTMSEVFGLEEDSPTHAQVRTDSDGYTIPHALCFVNRNEAGGRAYFLPRPEVLQIRSVLAEALPVRDVEIQEGLWPLERDKAYDGALTYLHKVKDGRDIYFFANSSRRTVNTTAVVRGRRDLEIWNPHDGTVGATELQHTRKNQQDVTEIKLVLLPVTSMFYIEKP